MAKNKRQTKDQKRKKKLQNKKRAARQAEANIFLDGLDPYAVELKKLIANPPIGSLLGIYMLSREVFNGGTYETQLAEAGIVDHSVIVYNMTNTDTKPEASEEATASGFTVALRHETTDSIRPAIFCRDDGGDPTKEVTAIKRLAVLLHELGHAADIEAGTNYDHKNLTCDITAAEAFAHNYLIDYAKRKLYRLLLKVYLDEVQQMADEPAQHVAVSAKQVLSRPDFVEIRRWAAKSWADEPGTPAYRAGLKRSKETNKAN